MDNGHWHHSVTVLSVVGLHTQVGASTCARACQCTRQMSGCVKEGSWYKVSHHQRVSASPLDCVVPHLPTSCIVITTLQWQEELATNFKD